MQRTRWTRFVIVCGLLFIPTFLSAEIPKASNSSKSEDDLYTYRSGLRYSRAKFELKDKQVQQVVTALREKTGFQELNFDADGFLRLGDQTKIEGGSATARELLVKTVASSVQLTLENHTHSSKVAFANLSNSVLYINMRTKQRLEHRVIRIDFSDFGKLMGRKEVLASFDLGVTLLHELVHGVLNLPDEVNEWEEIGPCERYVNTIRKELRLPERQQYVAQGRNVISPLGWTMQMAELQFARTNYQDGTLKTDEFKVSWDVKRVGLGERATPIPNAVATKSSERKSTAAIH